MYKYLVPVPAAAIAVLVMLAIAIPLGDVSAAQKPQTNIDSNGVAAEGYDLVSYFVEAEPKEGSRKFNYSYQGATYLFSSAENVTLFKKSPEKYLPAYGGFCSYGVVLGKKFDVSPDAYRIVNNVLFLQLDKGTRLIWDENPEKNIEIGDRTWPSIKNIPANDL